MKLPIKIRTDLKKMLWAGLLLGVAVAEVGCKSSDVVSERMRRDQAHSGRQTRQAQAKRRPSSRSFGSSNAGTALNVAPFFGNLSVVPALAGESVSLYRQTDCSLTYSSFTYTQSPTLLTATVDQQIPQYEKTIHNNAFLTTTPDLFPNGCADANQGITSQLSISLGLGKNGQYLGATVGAGSVYTAGMNSDVTFTVPASQATPVQPVTVMSGDLNRDGNADVVSINNDGLTASVTVFLGNSDGSYQTGVNYPLPYSAALFGVLDDLNGDGKLDLLASSSANGFAFSIFLGNGDGTFKAAQTFNPPTVNLSFTASFITADVNGDGAKDIITAQGQVFLGKGDGISFTQVPQLAFPPTLGSSNYGPTIVAADFNKDGKLDLATNDGVTIRTYHGNGDGTFTVGPAYATIPDRGYLIATDLDGDGNLDLLSGIGGNGSFGGDDYLSNEAYALMGNGDGTFQGAASLPATYTGTNWADLNGDGHLDLVGTTTIPNPNEPSTLVFTTSLGQSNGSFLNGPQLVAPPYVRQGGSTYIVSAVDSYAVGDLNGDHIPDLIYIPAPMELPVAGYYLALGNGDGSFQTPVFIAAPSFVAPGDIDINEILSGVVIADFNHDGKLDLAYSFSDQSSQTGNYIQGFGVQLGNGDGTFQAPVATTTYSGTNPPPTAFSPTISAVANVNKDNFPDVFLVLPGQIVEGTLQNEVELFVAKGDGSFKSPATLTLTGNILPPSLGSRAGSPFAFADLNGDGKVDLVAGGASADGTIPELAIALGNGDGTFQTATILTFQGFGFLDSPSIADFDGDGKLDVYANGNLTIGGGIFPGQGNGSVQTVSNGDGTVSAPQSVLLAVSQGSTAADLNGDGKPDLLVGNVVLLNKAGGLVVGATTTSLTAVPTTATAGQNVTLTATVAAIDGGTPTGTVTFYDGTTSLGTGSLSSGTAAYSTTSLAVGSHSITASYGGDANYASSTSVPVTVTITSSSPGDFTIGLSPTSGTVTPGDSSSSTITITPTGGFDQMVSLTCSGAPANATCMISPTSFALDGTDAATATLTIQTEGKSAALQLPLAPHPANTSGSVFSSALAFVIFSSGGLLGLTLLSNRRRNKTRWSIQIGLLLMVLTASFLTACGSSGSSNPTTPPGTYQITVTAAGGSNSHSQVFSLTVQ
jgi:Bacterial Ig-like domain (group 3)/FG-GAP-like repeat/FG-GAP repeat